MTPSDQEGIAIIGMAGRFPGAADVAAFWRNLMAGVESISTFSDEELTASGLDVAALKSDPNYVPARGILKDADCFDAAFFGMNPREAEVTDPQQRVFLEAAWEAMENAGYAPGKEGPVIGVYAGMTFNTYYLHNLHDRRDLLELVGPDVMMLGNEKDYLATRVAYKLNLRGPAINVSTACSTSLVAVGLACQSLLNYQCDLALAGGSSVTFPQKRGHRFQEGAITSPDGHTRTFDAQAQGTVFSDGVGVVVLKRVAEAMADGDQIYAVIKAVGLNNDGSGKVSFSAPGVDGQAEVIALAQAVAGVEPGTISYIEAHGTATPLGDPIEVAGLTQAFRAGTSAKNFCAIGSVKTNIGHLDAAAGVAGLIKTALALRHRSLPPTLHFTQPNPQIDFANSPFYVNTALTEWKAGATPRRAGVSSFGTGGTNAHAVLEEAPVLEPSGGSRPRHLLMLSAKTPSALDAATANLAAHFEANAETNLADAAFTLQVGRRVFPHRRMLVCSDPADAIAALKSGDAKRLITRHSETDAAEVVFLFPGQGAQYAGMGCELYVREPAFRAEVDRCADILLPELGVDLREVLRGPEDRLNQTRFAQPGLFVVEYALAKLWMSWGITPAAMLGHSVGEYVAGCLAGVFSLEDALRLVAARAALVQAQEPGAMLAVRLGESELAPLLGDRLSIAAVNSPRLCVASGPFDAIEALETALNARGVVARRLATSHAFHSAMMDPVIAPFTTLLKKVTLHPPQIRYVSNVTANWITDAEATDPNYWAAHVRQTVRYADSVAELLRNSGLRVLLEVGPGNTLSTLARQQATPAQVLVASLSEGDEQAELLGALGRLWLAGAGIDWAGFYAGEKRRRVALPAYPFERKRFLVEPARKPDSPSSPPIALPRVEAEAHVSKPTAPVEVGRADELEAFFRELSGIAGEIPRGVTFLELGFDSLLLTQASLALRQKFGVKITFRQLLEELSTLNDLAAFIERHAPQSPGVRQTAPPVAREAAPPSAPAAHGPFKPLQKDHGAAFTARQQAHLDALISRYEKLTSGSKRLTAEHRAHLADPRSVAGFRQAWKEITYPIVAKRSAGSRIWDVDGNEYVDFIMGFGANLFGHSPDFVTKAVEAQLKLGVEIGPQSAMAGEVARMICELTGAERAGFCNTGSEAVMAALRIARTVTGRDKVVTFTGDYHGVFDEVLVRSAMIDGLPGAAPIAPGIPPSLVANMIVLDSSDPQSLETLRTLAPDLAAVLVEPVQGRRPEFLPREYFREVRAITERAGTPLIFDEIVTGFRSHPGGMQALWDIRADITTYGKVIGGGFPIGVVAGRREYLDALDGGAWAYGDDSFPEVGVTFFAGTFVRHPVALAAARAVLTHLKERGPSLQSTLSERGGHLARRLTAVAEEMRAPLRVLNFGSTLFIRFLPEMQAGPLLFFHLREKGIHAWDNRSIILSTAHSDADLDRLCVAFRESLEELRAGDFLPATAAEGFPLTEPQREIWLATRMSEDASRAFNETFAIHLRGPLEESALRSSVVEIVSRHDALRTIFDPGGCGQSIGTEAQFEILILDFTEVPVDARAAKVDGVVAAENTRPFDLEKAPPFRVQLIRFDETHHVLVMAMHHLVVDGWSAGVLFHELKEIYTAKLRGCPSPLEPALQYRTYAEWLSGPTHAAAVAEAESYWLSKYVDLPEPVELPSTHARSAVKTYRATCERLVLDAEFSGLLRQAAARLGCTLTAYMLAGFKVWLHRLSGQRDMVVGVPAAGQLAAGSLPHSRSLVGHCVHLLPVRTECCGDLTFSAYLATVKRELLDASEHQDFTLGSLIEKLNPRRDAGRTPLVTATFNIDRAQIGFELPGLQTEITSAPKSFNFFDLSVNVVDAHSELRVDCNFNADLFDRTIMRGWLENFRTLLEGSVAEPATPISRLPMLSAAERQRILTEWSGTARPYPQDQTIAARFAECAAKTPGALAVLDGDERLTYAELDKRSNRVAHFLQARGMRAGDFVGLRAERSLAFVIKVLGIAKAGAAYLPLDESEPAERLAAMKAACAFILEAEPEGDLPGGAATSCAQAAGPAYVLFTSGSTGVPKGVVIPHRGITRLVVNNDYAPFEPADVVAFASNVCFDAATFEIWGALLNGGSLVITPHDVLLSPSALQAHLAKHRVSVLFLTTSLFNQLAHEAPAMFGGLRMLVFGGEAADAASVRLVLENGKPQRLVNGYGPTETTTFAICHVIEKLAGEAVPIGRPIANTQVFLLDREREPVPVGVRGEIFIGGPGVALGYLNEPALTAESFLETPLGRLYKTGDLARYSDDGTIEYGGRIDSQLKLRGFRIEPGEIEAALQRHPRVRQAAVTVRHHGDDRLLVAHLVPADASSAPDDLEMRSFLQQHLPAPMVPAAFSWLPALPLTPNGKVDRKALEKVEGVALSTGTDHAPASNELQSRLVEIWQTVLNRERVGIRDNFFALGGHSLLAARLITEVDKQLGHRLSIAALFQSPTIESLAERLEEEDWTPPWNSLVPLQPHGSKPPIFFVHGVQGDVYGFLELSKLLPADQPYYGIQAIGLDGKTERHVTVEDMAAFYVKEIVAFQPEGPLHLAGFSMGGVIAYEIAQQLHRRGRRVALLALLDSGPTGPTPWRYFALARCSYLSKRSLFHLRQLWRGSPNQGWFEYLHKRFASLLHYVDGNRRKAPVVTAPPQKGTEQPEVPGFIDYYHAVASAYRLHPYPGSLDLLVSVYEEDNWRWYWKWLVRGGVTFHAFPGEHMDLLFNPHGRALLAKFLTALLDRARQDEPANTPQRRQPEPSLVS